MNNGSPPPEPLLEAAEYYLSRRNFDSSRTYALRALQSNPNLPAAAQILAVAEVLAASETRISETLPDWYAILQVYRYSQDTHLIKTQFKKLILLLDQNDKSPLAQEAFKLVYDAYSVLSNPNKKAQYDDELQMCEFGVVNVDTIWTLCPYCYYLYEYARVYEDCCLRCQNCGRGFQAVAVKEMMPRLEDVEKGFSCMGVFPLGFDGVGRNVGSSWNPFTPLLKVNEDVEKRNGMSGVSESFVDISDVSNDSSDNDIEGNDEWVANPVMKRRKNSLAKNPKKMLGKGTRIGKFKDVPQNGEKLDLNAQAFEEDDGNGNGNDNGNGNVFGGVGGVEMGSGPEFDMSGVQFFPGDDDIFVGFPDCF